MQAPVAAVSGHIYQTYWSVLYVTEEHCILQSIDKIQVMMINLF